MERSTFQVTTPPQVVTITVDPLVQGALQALVQHMGVVTTLLQELHRETADGNARMRQFMETQAAADAFTNSLASALGGGDSMQNLAPGAVGIVPTAEDGLTQPTLPEGHLIAATGADLNVEAMGARAALAADLAVQPKPATELPDPDTLNWFVGKDGTYFIRGADGGADRRATAAEDAAIKRQVGSSRSRKRR